MPAGRPTKLTPALIAQIAELFFLAFTDQQVAFIVGVSERTIRRYRAGEFCPAIKIAELKREMVYRRKIWNAKGFWQGAAWFLERKYPQQFAKPEVQLQINTTNQTVNNTLIVTAEVAKEVVSRVKTVDAKIEKLFKDKRGNGNAPQLKPNGNGKSSSHPEAK